MATPPPRARSTILNRATNETKIQLSLNLDGGPLEEAQEEDPITTTTTSNTQPNGSSTLEDAKSQHATQSSASQHIDIDSGVGFLDHMLHALAKHAGW
ncbi:MAG: imidazoleglycerol-phosphate dehydratase, partial [Candelina submexicana]